MSHKLSDLLSTINGTELSSDFSHFWQIWGRTSSWFMKTFQLTYFPVRKKKKKKTEEFGTRQLFFTIYFYVFVSYQMHSLEDIWGQDQQLVGLVHERCNQWFILLWGGLESSLVTSKLSLTAVFYCELIFLIADALLSHYCKKRQLEQCFAMGMSSIICGKELSLLQNISSQLSGYNWQDSCPALTLRCPASFSGSQTLVVSILVQHPQSPLSH